MTKRNRWEQLDNGRFAEKVGIRRDLLRELGGKKPPVILETHCGTGALFNACYAHVRQGLAMDLEKSRATKVAIQRPTWRVYAGNSARALELGLAADLEFSFVDIDPYGSCWHHVTALFRSKRALAQRLGIVATDGLRLRTQMGGSAHARTPELDDARERFGNGTALYEQYLMVCEWLLTRRAEEAGFTVTKFRGFYNGQRKNMTQWGAILERKTR